MIPRQAQPCRSSALLDCAHQPCTISALPAMPPRPAQPCKFSAVPVHALKACHTGDANTHNLHSAGPWPPKPVKPGIHRHSGSPLCQPLPFRHTNPTLQRPTTSPQLKASTCRPMGPHPPSTCCWRAPNLLKRHTQTGLDAKGLASEQLRLQFYCSKTGDFFSLL
jgi:hypothetical protein